jgi:cholesterol oxidase
LDSIDELLSRHDRRSGLDHAQYVANPAWRPLPRAANGMLSGAVPGGRLITVHPLGGCSMADTGHRGVVDDTGEVFRGDGAEVHHGLHVLDGAIVPTSLGVNPFLTIAALAWRACDTILARLGESPRQDDPVLQPPRVDKAPLAANAGASPIVIRERLVGRLLAQPTVDQERILGRFDEQWNRWTELDGLILELETDPDSPPPPGSSEGATYLDALLRGHGRVPIKATLYRNTVGPADVRKARMDGIFEQHREVLQPVATGTGSITVLAPRPPRGKFELLSRSFVAVSAYLKRSGSPVRTAASVVCRARKGGTGAGALGAVKSWLEVVAMHATYRDFDYEITLTRPSPALEADRLVIEGTKRIAYRTNHDRLWQSLLRLPATLALSSGSSQPIPLVLDVDTRYMVSAGLLRIAQGPAVSVPHGILNATAFLGRFARSLLQSSLWEFAAPDYPAPEKLRPPRPELPASLNGVLSETFEENVPRRAGAAGETVPLRLTRYAQPPGREPKRVVLLVHGLAQGSLIYAHPSQPTNLAGYFHSLGDDVWLVDYRLSNQFSAAQVPFDGWTIDDIAEFDIPAAVNHVLDRYPSGTRVHVFAHCVGAVATSMAILGGRLGRDQLASLALNAIHPWIVPSPANDFRARLGVFVRDYLTDDFFDPRIPDRDHVDGAWSLMDRVAFSLARLGEIDPASRRVTRNPATGEALDTGHRRDARSVSEAICDRMTFLYGRMWRHENTLGVHQHWSDLVGRAPGAVQRQLYYLLNRQRVVTFEGENSFLTLDNVRHWAGIRTLFMHGDRSDVFNPQSADRSASRLAIAFSALGDSTPVGMKRIPEYGHMDVILADDAARTSFPYLEAFFAGGFDVGRESGDLSLDEPWSRHNEIDSLPPVVGPVLRGARMEGDRLQLRCWFELPTMTTTRLGDPQLVEPQGARWVPLRVTSHPPADDVPKEYRWADVYLDPASYRPLEIRVSGVGPSGQRRGVIRSVPPPVNAPRTLRSVEAKTSLPNWLARLRERSATATIEDCHFIVASCRYPGTPFDRESADEIFRTMLGFVERGESCDALFLIGDQIYADATAGLLDPSPWRDRYTDRYREAFRSPFFREVLAALPVHFAVDDHEFADNFPGLPADPDGSSAPTSTYRPWTENLGARARAGSLAKREFDFARLMARAYLGSGREFGRFGSSAATAGDLWYALEDGNEFPCPAFVMDTRSERQPAAPGQAARLMDGRQLEALIGWLTRVARERPDEPKFIFSGSVIAPLARGAPPMSHFPSYLREDGLAAYPDELTRIVRHIVEGGIRRVVFVGGDLHLSAGCELTLSSGTKSVAALQVVASGLYAPLPFANFPSSSVDWNRSCDIWLSESRIGYVPHLLCEGRSHFVHVSARRSGEAWTISMNAHDAAGDVVKRLDFTL